MLRTFKLSTVLLLTALFFSSWNLLGADNTNFVKFSQKFGDKLKSYVDSGDSYTDQVETWNWTFSGKVYGDFSGDEFFQDATPLEIIIGNFNTADYFATLADIQNYVSGTDLNLSDSVDKKEQKLRGKVTLVSTSGTKNKGSITYSVLFSWEGNVSPNSDRDAPVLFKKTCTVTLKWDAKSLTFKVSCKIGTNDSWNGAMDPGVAESIAPMSNPVSPDGKPVVNTQDVNGTIACQLTFGSRTYANAALGYSGTQQVKLFFKGPDKDQYILNNHSIKELAETAQFELTP